MTSIGLSVERHGIDDGSDEGRIVGIKSNRGDEIDDGISDQLDGITLELRTGVLVFEDVVDIRKVGPIGNRRKKMCKQNRPEIHFHVDVVVKNQRIEERSVLFVSGSPYASL